MKRWLVIMLVVIAGAIGWAVFSLKSPYKAFEGEEFVTLEHGTGTPALAGELQKAGVIHYGWQFWVERALHPSAKLQAGEYRFSEPASAEAVFNRIVRGDIFYYEVKIPEGSNIFDIARILESAGAMPAEDFIRAASDASLIQDLAPHAPSLEGYLFPSTYRLSHSTTAADFCKRMTTEFRRQWKKLSPGNADVHRTVTLASMVEKETGIAQERPLVASVFTNRLGRGMNLECDPTTIYAAMLENRYHGVIYRSDLDNHNPYNTYRNAGLPPGPIANPGAESLVAALHPAETDYLYFVAHPSGGGHQFSSTYSAHQKAVETYRHGAKIGEKSAKAPRKAA